MTTEADIQDAIRLAATKMGARLHRNNCGVLQDARGQYVRYGVGGNGGSDLIGWDKTGRFVAIEVKRPGKHPTPEQAAFIAAVIAAGGIAGVAHSVEEFHNLVRDAI